MDLAIDKFDKRRFGLVTGSKVSPLVPKRDAEKGRIALAQQLAMEKYYGFYDEVVTWQLEHGNMGEYWAREHYRKYIGQTLGPRFIFKNENEGGTIDDEGLDPDGVKHGMDYKCPTSLKNWLSYLFEGISDYEYNQAQHYMNITGYKRWYVCAYLLETKFMDELGIRYPVDVENRMIRIRVDYNEEWKQKYDNTLPLLIADRDKYYSQLVDFFKAKK